jgi:hypothetical protein
MKRILIAICTVAAAICSGSCQNEEEYLVRETDAVRFDTPRENKRKISLRCVGTWKTIVPQGSEWVSTTPSEGVGDGTMQFIYVNASTNRGTERTATIYLENGGRQYPITVSQAAGAIIWGDLTLNGDIVEDEPVRATLYLPYSNTIGDENVNVTCTVSGSVLGLVIDPVSVNLDEDTGRIEIPVSGTPSGNGNITISASVDGIQVASAIARVYGIDETILEGLPVQWEFKDIKGSSDDKTALENAKPEWKGSEHYVKSDNQNGAAMITVVEATGKIAAHVNSWGFNDGHVYIKGLYADDYWLLTIPVKNLPEGQKIKIEGNINGSGSAPAFFLIEYSADGESWAACDDIKTMSVMESNVSYHVQAKDAVNSSTDGDFSTTFTMPLRISDGNLYIRARVSADIRITLDNTITTSGGGSSRLKGTWKVSTIE